MKLIKYYVLGLPETCHFPDLDMIDLKKIGVIYCFQIGGWWVLLNYGFIALFLIVALGFTLTTILLPTILKRFRIVPHKPSQVKNEPFECGMTTIGKTWVQFNFRYYFYALIFLALDVMVVFLYPWAVGLRVLGIPAFIVMLIFIVIIMVAYIYAWKKKALEWK
jgi:NADH-quinone oxidoreductase subunit A